MKTQIEALMTKDMEVKRVTKDATASILEWWKTHVHIIGKHVGKYSLKDLCYSNAYGGCYTTEIVSGWQEAQGYDSDDSAVYGFGYYGSTYGWSCATRVQHIEFLNTFFSLVLKKLQKIEKLDDSLTEICDKIEQLMKAGE